MALLCGQYGESSRTPSEGSSGHEGPSKNVIKLVYAAIGIVLLVIVYFAFFSGPNTLGTDFDSGINTGNPDTSGEVPETGGNTEKLVSLSGNGWCDPQENCADNPKDCICLSGEYCSSEAKKCIKPVCGDGTCGAKEYPSTCCQDCGCTHPACETCDATSGVCKVKEPSISDDSVIEAVRNYYQGKGVSVAGLGILGSSCAYMNETVKLVEVNVSGSDVQERVGVTESGNVISLTIA